MNTRFKIGEVFDGIHPPALDKIIPHNKQESSIGNHRDMLYNAIKAKALFKLNKRAQEYTE